METAAATIERVLDREDAAGPAVPLLDLTSQHAALHAQIMEALHEVCVSQHFILGPRVGELERRVAAYCGCRFAIGVSSGTDALLVALMALGIGPGDEVITSPYTFFATGGAIARLGARPLFCDISPSTFNLSPVAVHNLLEDLARRRGGAVFNRKTGAPIKALVPVHLFGQTAEMEQLMSIARAYDLKVVEDAAQAIGAECPGGERAGSVGDVGCFSFFPSKNLGAFGDAGMCTTNDEGLADRMRTLRAHGAHPKYYHALIGGNFRLDEIQAAVLLIKFDHLERWTSQRRTNAAFYDGALSHANLRSRVTIPAVPGGGRHVYNQYVIRARSRDALKRHLADARIGSEVYYPLPLHRQECFRHLVVAANACPEADRASEESIAIPIYPGLTQSQQSRVVESISGFYR